MRRIPQEMSAQNVIPVSLPRRKASTAIQESCYFNRMERGGYVYIISNKNRTVLYTGVTSNLYSRIYEHKSGEGSIFARKYNCTDLLYFETFPDIESAIKKEKQIKKWKREYKESVINELNPDWLDLYDTISEYN